MSDNGNGNGVPPIPSGLSWTQQMEAVAARSEHDSLIEAQTNQEVNRNNGMAQSAAGIGRA
jgi:hypothetical protein